MKKKYVLIGLLLLLVVSQFIKIDKNNPPVDPSLDYLQMVNADPETKSLIKNACYDCHSHETEYPWYTDVAPVSWWIKSHINGGREKLNFSEWGKYNNKKQMFKQEECGDIVEKKWMPLTSYAWLHSKAKLTEDQREALVQWFRRT